MVSANSQRLILFTFVALSSLSCLKSNLPISVEHRSDAELISLLSDRSVSVELRQSSARTLAAYPGTNSELGLLLRGIVANPRERESFRLWCVDFLAESSLADASRQLGHALVQLRYSVAVRDRIILHLHQLNDPSIIPLLFDAAKSDKTLTDLKSNSYTRLIERLGLTPWPRQLPITLLSDASVRTKMRAIEYTYHALGSQATSEIVLETRAIDSVMLRVLHRWIEEFDYLPFSPQRFASASIVLAERSDQWQQRLATRVHQLRANGRYEFKVRDAYLINLLAEDQFSESRAVLAQHIRDQLSVRKTAYRRPSYESAPDTIDERFDQAQLSIIDMWTLRRVQDSLAQPAAARRIAELIAMDIADNSAEIGGICTIQDDQLVWKVYAPMITGNDTAYVGSDQLIHDALDALCYFHLHVARRDKAEVAGPGPGDLRFANAMDANALVITDLGKSRFNVDYYNAEETVVDLGVYRY